MKKLLFCCLFLFIYSNSIFAQPLLHPYNLDFGLSQKGSIPVGWIMNNSDKKLGYDAYAIDSLSNKHYFALKITTPKPGAQFAQNESSAQEIEQRGTVFQTFLAEWFRNKKVKFSAKVTYKAQNPGDYLLLIIQNENPITKFIDIKISDTIRNAKEDYYSVISSIDTNAGLIRVGFMLYGTTEAIIEESNFEPLYETTPQSTLDLSSESLQNLKLIARIYGVAKYFYPDSNLNVQFWENILYKNVQDAVNTRNTNDFIAKIEKDYNEFIPKFSINKSNKTNQKQVISRPYKSQDTVKKMYNYTYYGGVNVLPTTAIRSKIWNIYESQRSAIATMMQIINVRDKKFTELNFSAKIKFVPKNLSGNAIIALRFDDPNNFDLLDKTSQIISDTTNDWVEIKIKTDVPENTANIRIGMMMSGEGTAYFDNFQVTARDKTGNNIPLEIRNPDFDDRLIGTAIPSWIFTRYSSDAGYSVGLDSINVANGKYSLRISSDTNFVRFAPPQAFYSEVFNNIEFTIPIQENEFTGKEKIDTFLKNNTNVHNSNDAISRICVAIDLWNIYRHFSLNQSNDSLFDITLENTIKKVAESGDENEFRRNLEEIPNDVYDASFKIWNGLDKTLYFPEINIIFENDKFLIYSKTDKIQSSSQAIAIDDIDLDKLRNEIFNWCSAYKSNIDCEINQKSIVEKELLKLLSGNRDEKIEIKYLPPNSTSIRTESIARNLTTLHDITKPEFSIELEPGTIYLNAAMVTDDDFKRILPELEKDITKGIIFDFRGYSLLSEHILGFFRKNGITNGISIIPCYTTPTEIDVQNNMIISSISPLERLINKKVVFLMNGKTTSYSEYILGLAKINKIGTIIGTQSQGNFVETNRVLLSGYYFASVSGQKFDFVNQLVSPKTPLKPDIEIENTFDNYLKNEDMQLKTALEYLRNQK